MQIMGSGHAFIMVVQDIKVQLVGPFSIPTDGQYSDS